MGFRSLRGKAQQDEELLSHCSAVIIIKEIEKENEAQNDVKIDEIWQH